MKSNNKNNACEYPKHIEKCEQCKYWRYICTFKGSRKACHYLLDTKQPRIQTRDDCLSFIQIEKDIDKRNDLVYDKKGDV